MEGIDNKYIKEAINELAEQIGIKEEIDHKEITSFVLQGKIKECIEKIAKYLRLPIRVNLKYVSDEYDPNDMNKFHSAEMVKTSKEGKGGSWRGTESITAQVFIPSYLPMYGTSELENFLINVKISENCAKEPKTFIAIMAHELSHIVLHSILHKEKDNEVYTDITAMLLGFSLAMKYGREVIKTKSHMNEDTNQIITETQTTKYGYLSDSQSNFAYDTINSILNKCKKKKNNLISNIKKLKIKIKKNKRIIIYFIKYLEYIDKNIPKKISKEDANKISMFHQSGYIDNFNQILNKIKNEIRKFEDFIEKLNYYNNNTLNRIEIYKKDIDTILNSLNIEYSKLILDVSILKKYISTTYKLRIFLSLLINKEKNFLKI